jgi:hypothetical protein
MSMTVINLTEADMLAGIKSVAKTLGYKYFHNTYAIGSDRGFPDLVIVGYGRTWFLELKGPKPHIYPEQIEWNSALRAVGQDARFIHPEDFDDLLEELQLMYHRRER